MVFDISDFIALLKSSANSDCLYLLLIGRKVYGTNIIYEISRKKFSKRVMLSYSRFLPLNESRQYRSTKDINEEMINIFASLYIHTINIIFPWRYYISRSMSSLLCLTFFLKISKQEPK